MPLKVRCRCGQEFVLRYSEWVYFVVGFLVLSLLVNVVVLVLIYNQLRTADDPSAPSATAPAAPARPLPHRVSVARENRSATLPRPVGQENTEGDRPPPEPPPAASRPTNARPAHRPSVRPLAEIKKSPWPLPRPGDESSGIPPSGDAAAGDGAPPPPAAVDSAAPKHRPNGSLTGSRIAAAVEALPHGREPPGAVTPESVTQEVVPPEAVNSARFRALGREFPPALRYSIAEALRDADTADAVRIWSALLLDPDERVRNRARFLLVDRLFGGTGTGVPTDGGRTVNASVLQDPALRDFVARWVRRGAAWIGTTDRGRELVRRFGGGGGDDGADAGPTDRDDIEDMPWETVRQRALKFVTSTDELRFLRDVLDQRSSNGTDVLLVVDVTESMAEPLAAIRRVSRWLLPLVVWSGRRCRVAGLFYRDDVVATVDFNSDTTNLIAALEREQATGGGADVPEGVFEALRGALQLGRFSWRSKAEKIVIVVGDAPPPYAKKEALLTLAEQAHREAGYQINALSVRDWDGWDGVPFFPQLAKRGGGRAITIKDTDSAGENGAHPGGGIASTIFELSLPAFAKATAGDPAKLAKFVESLFPHLRRGFGG